MVWIYLQNYLLIPILFSSSKRLKLFILKEFYIWKFENYFEKSRLTFFPQVTITNESQFANEVPAAGLHMYACPYNFRWPENSVIDYILLNNGKVELKRYLVFLNHHSIKLQVAHFKCSIFIITEY